MAKKLKIILITIIVGVCLFVIKSVFTNHISTVEDFQKLMSSYGVLGPLVLTAIQAIQVVIPILPGYLGCAVGAMSYGTVIGFLCNYIGISAGSIIAFFLAEKYGKQIVVDMFSENYYDKWKNKIEGKKSYDIFLFVATLLPFFPDDFLCYFSGLIKMDRKKFVWIIITGKPWCILLYSIIFGMIK